LLQNYALLVGSLASVVRQKLSQNDVDFAISAAHSPVFHYLLLASIVDLVSRNKFPGTFDGLGRLRLPSQLLLLSIVPLWATLSAVTWMIPPPLNNAEAQACSIQLEPSEWLQKLAVEASWINHGLHDPLSTGSTEIYHSQIAVRLVSILVVFSVAINLICISPKFVVHSYSTTTTDIT
jgi:hypothetical protein